LVGARRDWAVAKGLAIRYQRSVVRLPLRPILHDIGKQRLRIGFGPGRQLDGFQPCICGRRLAARGQSFDRVLDDVRIHG
jgi:hypothetical protein